MLATGDMKTHVALGDLVEAGWQQIMPAGNCFYVLPPDRQGGDSVI
jgi:hypothetical protein